MPKTPVQSESGNRFNPYITKSISKTLLTPCRQIGLSRKRKTLNNSVKSLGDSNVSDVCSHSDNSNITPVTSQKVCIESSNQETKLQPELSESLGKTKTKKKSISKCLIVDDSTTNSLKVQNLFNEHSESQTHNVVSKAKFDFKSTLDHDYLKSSKNKSKEKLRATIDKSIFQNNTHILKETQNEENDFSKNLKTDTLTSTSTKSQGLTFTKSEETMPFSKTKTEDERFIKNEKKTKLKRSLSMKKSFDNYEDKKKQILKETMKDCSENLSHLEVNYISEINISVVNKLEKQVQEKQKLLEDLKQADIYKKLHDIDKLQDLTLIWKNGCIAALNDLLIHLQRHTNMDMGILLNNLQVPIELIRLSESGDLT